jgi:hypothetical protein
MLLWLAEALELPENELQAAVVAVLAAPARNASRCAALRNVLPWRAIEVALAASETWCDRLCGLLSDR